MLVATRSLDGRECIPMPPPPVVATRVARTAPQGPGADAFMARFSSAEQAYLGGMKRKDRTELLKPIHDDADTAKRAATPLRIQVLQSSLPAALRVSIFEELRTNPCDKYVQWVRKAVALPIGVVRAVARCDSREAVARAQCDMDAHITGNDVAKREILKMVCQQAATGGVGCGSAYSIGLEGAPGTGKTHFVRTAIAAALKRPLVSIPLGGASDASYLLGNLYTYEGSKEGRLATALVEAGCCNPIVHFDEVDKISTTERGIDVVSTLIHLVDPTANVAMRDRYFHGIDLDFSKCTFVFSYNDPSQVSPILLDRIKRISVEVPNEAERLAILRDHLVPRTQARLRTSLLLGDTAASVLLSRNASGGMRALEKDVDHVVGAAQLCTLCGEHNSGGLAGVTTTVLDDDGRIRGEFAKAVLQSLRATASAPPPSGMYA